jgi:hypothetical protein
MSEEITEYIVVGKEKELEEKRKINLIAKRFGDIVEDIGELNPEDKRYIVRKLDKHKPNALIGLYNLVLDYME